MGYLSRDELDSLLPAETSAFPGPIPTQIVGNRQKKSAMFGLSSQFSLTGFRSTPGR